MVMSVLQIKAESRQLSPAEVLHLAAWFQSLSRQRSPAYLAGLDATWDEMNSDGGVKLDDVKRLDAELHGMGA